MRQILQVHLYPSTTRSCSSTCKHCFPEILPFLYRNKSFLNSLISHQRRFATPQNLVFVRVKIILFQKVRTSHSRWGQSHALLTRSMQQSPSSEANRFSASLKIPRIFLEPEGSSLHSQVPVICPYPEPARSIPCPHIPLPEDPC
jgi:hypothetical protein